MRRKTRVEEPADADNPLMTGFWIGFWSLLILIVGSWFVPVPLLGQKTRPAGGRVSFFREDPAPRPADRGIAGSRSRPRPRRPSSR